MNFLFVNKIRYISLSILLTFYISTSCSVDLSGLKEMCCIDSGRKEIKSIPSNSNCTGIAWFSDGNTRAQDIEALKGQLKNVYIYNKYKYYQYDPRMRRGKTNSYVEKICKLIDKYKIDILIFNRLFWQDKSYDNGFQMDIRALFIKLKIKKPNILFGLMIRSAIGQPGFNLKYLEKEVQFFVIRTFDYRLCYYTHDQKDMDIVEKVEDMENSIKYIISLISSQKVCIVIRIIVKTTRYEDALEKNDFSYKTFCETKAHKKRRFCIDTLSDFYQKGRLVPKYNLSGALIQSYDRDDSDGKCDCGYFPVMTAISAGLQNYSEPAITKCSNWTIFPRDRQKD